MELLEPLAPLDNGKAFAGATLGQVDGSTDTGQTGTDNEDIENFIFHARFLLT